MHLDLLRPSLASTRNTIPHQQCSVAIYAGESLVHEVHNWILVEQEFNTKLMENEELRNIFDNNEELYLKLTIKRANPFLSTNLGQLLAPPSLTDMSSGQNNMASLPELSV